MISRQAGGRGLREECDMADKGARSVKAVGIVADLGAFYVVRWLLSFGWRQITGREPPTDPEDLHRGIGESLAWAVILGGEHRNRPAAGHPVDGQAGAGAAGGPPPGLTGQYLLPAWY